MPNQPADSAASFGQLLVAQIPSEALVGYTTLLALLAAGGSAYRTGRWILYVELEDPHDAPAPVLSVANAPPTGSTYAGGSTAVLTLSAAPDTEPAIEATPVRARSKLHPPILPVATAMLSMAVYGLTVPGSPLQYEVSGTAFGIWSACLAVGGGVMMSLFVPFLGKGNAVRPVKEPAAD